MNFLITGGSGFIGSALIRYIISNTDHRVANVDKLTYAGNQENLREVEKNKNYFFHQADICNYELLEEIFLKFKPNIVMHLAAESHVDNSISGPSEFIKTNILGTFNLLEISREYISKNKIPFTFHHISTDEVYGDLKNEDDPFTEKSRYQPSSPYSASKASSDHLVRAWNRTYKIPTIISNCSNNYGPFHHPEKFIPQTITKLLMNKRIPIYGDGNQIRDWLFVDDHAEALFKVATSKKYGETYNIGGNCEMKNIEVVKFIIHNLSSRGVGKIETMMDLIDFVEDRPGHDKRYAIDNTKIKNDLGWSPKETFESGIEKTIEWFIKNKSWVRNLKKN